MECPWSLETAEAKSFWSFKTFKEGYNRDLLTENESFRNKYFV